MKLAIDVDELLKPIVKVLWEKIPVPASLILLAGIIILLIVYLIRRRKP